MFEECFGKRILSRVLGQMCWDEVAALTTKIEKSYKYKDWYRDTYGYYSNCSGIFETIDLAPVKKIVYTDSMKKKDIAESNDRKKKERRDYLIQREQELSELLNRLESEKKRLEKERNLIDIERLGFNNETSFRGEFYHGQKRKKK